MTKIFVYGTLMLGGCFNRYLPFKGFKGLGHIKEFDMWNVGGSYPAITHGTGTVRGELYSINSRIRDQLDIIEGEGRLYAREPVDVYLDTGGMTQAGVYVFIDSPEKAGYERIVGGVWENKG